METIEIETSPMLRLWWVSWLVVILAPLWALALVEVLRRVNFLELNRYSDWQFGVVLCTDEALGQLPSQPLWIEYLHWPTLDAWMAMTVAFSTAGLGLLMVVRNIKMGAKLTYRVLTCVLIAIVSALFSQGMLMAPKGTQIPFLVFTLFGLLFVLTAFYIMSSFGVIPGKLLMRATAPVFGAYGSGVCIGIGWWLLLMAMDRLPYLARCQAR